MTIDIAQGIGYCFTYPADYDDAPQDRRWACDIATVKDADGVRRVYATDCRAAVQVTTDGFGIGSAWGGSGYVPDGFRLDQVRAFFEHWPTDASADFEPFNLYHANLASAVRAVWRDWICDPMAMDDLTIDPYAFTQMRIAMPDKRRTLFAFNYMHKILTAIPDWTVCRAYMARNVRSVEESFMRLVIGDSVRVVIMPLRLVSDYVESGSSVADAATGTPIHSRGDAGMDWPQKTEEGKQ